MTAREINLDNYERRYSEPTNEIRIVDVQDYALRTYYRKKKLT